MPLDPRIPLGVESPPMPSPFEALTAVAQLQGVRENAELRREQIEARRLAAEEARTRHVRQQQIDQAFEAAVKTDPETGEITLDENVLFRGVPGSLHPELRKQLAQDKESVVNLRTATLNLEKAKVQHLGSAAQTVMASGGDPTIWGVELKGAHRMKLIDDETYAQLSARTDPKDILALAQSYVQRAGLTPKDEGFTLSPGQTRYGPRGAVIAAAPATADEETFTLSPGQVRYGPGGTVLAKVPPAPPAPRHEELKQIIGPNGQPIWVRESQAVGQPAGGGAAGRPATGAERGALAFYNRGLQALETLTTPDTTGTSLEDRVSGAGLEWVPEQLKPVFQTEAQKRYTQAQRAFTEARLRKESGAAINPSEYENDRKTYFKQPNDPPAVVEQKRLARQKVLNGLAFSAGKAYEEYYGEPFTRETGAPEAPPPPRTPRKNPFRR